MLDDYHVIGSPPVHESLGFLLEHRPPGLHLVLASRSDPPLPWPRLRARGQLTELRAADLRFTPGEAALLLQQVAAVPGGAPVCRRGRRGAGGPDRGLGGRAAAGRPVAARTGRRRRFRRRVHRQPPLRPGLPGRGGAGAAARAAYGSFCWRPRCWIGCPGTLCDAVTGRTDGQALLEQVERAGLFLVPLDEVRGWWRYHHLFADLLRARLQQEQPGRVPELHHAAAAWYDEHGLADDAIRHAVAAGETDLGGPADRAALTTRCSTCTARGRRWSDGWRRCPTDLIRSRPRLLLAQALLALISGRLDGGGTAARRGPAGVRERGRTSRSSPPSAGPRSLLVNVPALIAIHRGFLAQLRGDADATHGIRRRGAGRGRRGRVAAELHRPGIPGRRRVASAASWPRPSAPSCPASPSGERPACPR